VCNECRDQLGFPRSYAGGVEWAVRGEVPVDAAGDDTEVAFIGGDDTVAVFSDVAGLARYCRTAKEHRLMKLEFWTELADQDDDEAFTPEDAASFDLRKPSTAATELLRELVDFCGLEMDAELLGILDNAAIDRDDWRELVTEVETCFQQQD
jgi:hypothetical protein